VPRISDKDREKIIKALAEGKDLSSSFQAKLFDSDEVDYVEATKDYKLVYKGKTPEARVIAETPAAPLQEIREFNTDNAFYNDWANMLILVVRANPYSACASNARVKFGPYVSLERVGDPGNLRETTRHLYD